MKSSLGQKQFGIYLLILVQFGLVSKGLNAQTTYQSPLNLTITFDSWPEESSWDIRLGDTTVLHSVDYSNLGDDSDGITLYIEDIHLPAGSGFHFNFYDAFIDGICCIQGDGSFTLKDNEGQTILTGGEFETQVSAVFDVAGDLCSNGIQDNGEADIDCGGSCTPCIVGCTSEGSHNYNPMANSANDSCETCVDGLLNGDETDIDCGGDLCTPCASTCQDTFNSTRSFAVDTTIQASKVITSCHKVESGLAIQFDAGEEINLHAGFEIGVGASFEARIEGCEE